MNHYLFDVECVAAIRVDATSLLKARNMVAEALQCADTNFGAFPDGSPILGELSERVIRCVEVNGASVEGYISPAEWRNEPTRQELVDALRESLSAWEDEEDSVQEEHEELIESLRVILARVQP